MGMKVGELFAELGLDDSKFNTKLSGAKKALGGITKVAAGAAVGAGAVLAGVATKGVKEFASFEKGMNEVFTLLPNASKDAMAQMQEDIRGFSVEMGVATDDAVPALYQAISAGVPADNVFDFLETAQQAAVGGVTDLTTVVDGISSVINAYGSDVLSAGEASDLMFTAVKKGKTTFEELSSSLYNVIPTASALGVNFGDITAAIASMTAQGTPTAQATTQIRQALNELSTAGSDASDIFKEVAGKSFTEFIAQGGNMQEALAIMSQAASESGVSVKDLFSSVEAGQAALALTGKGAKTFKENILEMADSAGSTKDAYETMDESLSRTFDKLTAAAHDVFLEVGKQLQPAMEQLASWITSHMPEIKQVVSTVFKTIGDIFDFIVNDVIPPAIKIYENLTSSIKSNSGQISDVIGRVRNVFQTVFGFIMDEIVPRVMGVYRSFREYFADDNNKLMQSLGEVREKFGVIFEKISELVQAFVTVVLKLWDTFGEDIIECVKIAWETVAEVYNNALDIVIGILDTFIGLFTGDWEKFGNGIEEIFQGIWDTIASILKGAWKIISGPLTNIINKIRGAWDGIVDYMKNLGKNIIQGLIDGILSMASNVVNAIKGVVGSIIGTAKNDLDEHSPSKVFQGIGENVTAGLQKGIEGTQNSIQMQVSAMVEGMIPKTPQTAGVGAGGPQVINLTANYYGIDNNNAKTANNDLVSKLQGRGIGGAYR